MSGGRLAKPQMRDLHHIYAKRTLALMTVVTLGVGLSYKIFVSDVYERKMEEFYKDYDPHKSLAKMDAAGLMQSTSSQ